VSPDRELDSDTIVQTALAADLVGFIGSSGVFTAAVYHQEAAVTCDSSTVEGELQRDLAHGRY
jgi:hypothetical protein